ncbi:MAG TPA: hypothetical protein VHM20_06050 [Gammaproteobacteria bacterium]|nr:hypothetical protein [Gammaproteobacteria bacterium]
MRENLIHFLRCYPWLAFATTLLLLYFPMPFLGWIILSLTISSLISFKLKYILQKPTTLLHRLDHLPAQEVQALKPEDIERFKKFAKPDELLQLTQYEKFMNESCGITLSEMHELTSPITIQHRSEPPHLAKTYEKEALRTWIITKGFDVTEPLKRWYKLKDPKLEIYSGYPRWIQTFIEHVLTVLKNNPKTKKEKIAEERDQYYQKNFKFLFRETHNSQMDQKNFTAPGQARVY